MEESLLSVDQAVHLPDAKSPIKLVKAKDSVDHLMKAVHNVTSADKLPSHNSLQMLKLIENFRLTEEQTAIAPFKKKRVPPVNTDSLRSHDGLNVDYE